MARCLAGIVGAGDGPELQAALVFGVSGVEQVAHFFVVDFEHAGLNLVFNVLVFVALDPAKKLLAGARYNAAICAIADHTVALPRTYFADHSA